MKHVQNYLFVIFFYFILYIFFFKKKSESCYNSKLQRFLQDFANNLYWSDPFFCSPSFLYIAFHTNISIDAWGSNTAIYINFKSLDLHTFKDKLVSVFLI